MRERDRAFVDQAQRSRLDDWMAQRAQDDLIATLEDRVALEAACPNTEAEAIELLFIAREVAPTDAAVLGGVREVERTIARKPGLKTAMMEVGRPVAGAF